MGDGRLYFAFCVKCGHSTAPTNYQQSSQLNVWWVLTDFCDCSVRLQSQKSPFLAGVKRVLFKVFDDTRNKKMTPILHAITLRSFSYRWCFLQLVGRPYFRSNHSQWFCEQSVPCAHFVTVRSRWLQKKRKKKKVNTPFSPMGLAKTDREGFSDGARQLYWQSKGGLGGLRVSVCVSGEGVGAAFVLWQRKLPTRMTMTTMTPTNHLLLTLFLTYHLSIIDTPIFHLNTFHRGPSRTPKQYFTHFPWFLTFMNFLP